MRDTSYAQYGELIVESMTRDRPGVTIDVCSTLMVDRVKELPLDTVALEFALDELSPALRATPGKVRNDPQLRQIRCESAIVSETLDESDRLR